MKNIPLSARYAKAYIDLALERGNLEQSVEAVRSVMARMESDEKLAGMLNSPLVSRQDKAAGFAGAMGDTIPQQMKDFADLVMDKGRSSIFSEILEQVIAQNDALQGVLHTGVATAVPLSVEQEKQVVEKVKAFSGAKTVVLHTSVDASLLGGMKITVGDKVWDDTVAGRLEEIKKTLA